MLGSKNFLDSKSPVFTEYDSIQLSVVYHLYVNLSKVSDSFLTLHLWIQPEETEPVYFVVSFVCCHGSFVRTRFHDVTGVSLL